MTLQDLLLQQFKVKTRANVNPEITIMTGGVDRVLSNNPNRVGWFIMNLGANAVYLSLLRNPSSTKGILLSPGGGFASMRWDTDFDAVGWELFAKGTLADNIYVLEVLTTE